MRNILYVCLVHDPKLAVGFLQNPPTDFKQAMTTDAPHAPLTGDIGFTVHAREDVLPPDCGMVVFGDIALSLGEAVGVLAPMQNDDANWTPYMARQAVAVLPNADMIDECATTLKGIGFVQLNTIPKPLFMLFGQGLFQACAAFLEAHSRRAPKIVTANGVPGDMRIG